MTYPINISIFTAAAGLILWNTHSSRRKIQNRKLNENSSSKQSPGTTTGYDVLIVGAGPSGSTAAYYLGKMGYKVCLVDKKKFPRAKPCGNQ